jgi:phage shock protein PspC (stress-responsive transcriptional regulator)
MKLSRSRYDRRLAGVCGGVAEHFEQLSSQFRAACFILDIFLYLALWFLLPRPWNKML